MTETRRQLRVETNPAAIEAGFTYMTELAAVREGVKPLMIASEGKSPVAYKVLRDIVDADDALEVQISDFICEDGVLYEHAFVCRTGASYAREAVRLIFDTISKAVIAETPHAAGEVRRRHQLRLGLLLGHSAAECAEFSDSELGRTCPCDCCGSEFTAETVERPRVPEGWAEVEASRNDHDEDAMRARRTQYHA